MIADMVVDLQFGSTGKGLIAGFLAEDNDNYSAVVNANMPNAGHTYIDSNGKKFIHKVLPNGIVGRSVKYVMIGPGSVFDIDRLMFELHHASAEMVGKKLVIHENAVVLHKSHIEAEKASLNHISSTMQGSAEAMISKIRRSNGVCAKYTLKRTPLEDCVVTNNEWLDILYNSERILIEGAQGYSLGINAGFYPYCTSRDCTPSRFMADCGVPHNFLENVIGTARTYPIRVGNTEGGHSGDIYPDQKEITWESLGLEPERTTVTNRVRRVFTFSTMQIDRKSVV